MITASCQKFPNNQQRPPRTCSAITRLALGPITANTSKFSYGLFHHSIRVVLSVLRVSPDVILVSASLRFGSTT